MLDVRWELAGGPDRPGYLEAHLPGAVFVDLDAELAAPPGPGGRHPLPSAATFEAAMRRAGVSPARPVVSYDAAGGMAAARAWWLLRYFGHGAAAVLDGGLAAWRAAGLPVQQGEVRVEPGDFTAAAGNMPLLDAGAAPVVAEQGLLIDARAPERFRGEVEPIDPVAGHIPGAVNRPAALNVDAGGRFRPPDELRQEFTQLGVRDGVVVGTYCGSGVSAAQVVLALELAGHRASLYAGSWSEWITDPARPVERG